MSLPEGQRVKSGASAVNTQDLCPGAFRFDLRALCLFLMYSAPDPDVADAHIPVDKLPRWDYSVSTTPWFIFSEPFLSPTSDGKHDLDAFCGAAVD